MLRARGEKTDFPSSFRILLKKNVNKFEAYVCFKVQTGGHMDARTQTHATVYMCMCVYIRTHTNT